MSQKEFAANLKSRLGLEGMSSKAIVAISALVVAVVFFSVYLAINGPNALSNNESELEPEIEIRDTSNEEASSGLRSEDSGNQQEVGNGIFVHVTGCVKEPGVYRLDEGSRANAAIDAAGGFTKSADIETINLAEPILDGQQIVVPEKGSPKSTSDRSSAEKDGNVASTQNPGTSSGSAPDNGSKININTASSEELQTLSGIGEAKAAKIIDYRNQNGPFGTIDELTNVSGIGEKTLESIRSSICT